MGKETVVLESTENTNIPLQQRATSRRFIMAMIFTIGGTVGLFFDKLDSEHYYWLAAAVLGGYAATEFTKGKKPTP